MPVLVPSPADIAYAAGFIDGEGCIAVYKQTDGTLRAHVSVGQKYPSVLEWLAARWGSRPRRCGGFYQWRVVSGMAVALCRDIEPFVIVKRAQLVNVLRFAESQTAIAGWVGDRRAYQDESFAVRSRALNSGALSRRELESSTASSI